ncbi:MAG: type II toxin-antitoxin system Phd/YefM family antitoxin [bacterium]|nr:type II toxin-antitoxin system Phd/YefM family antitoxin [bacterium]
MAIETLPVSEARNRLPQMIKDVDRFQERFIITQNGRPKAVMIGLEEYEEWIETLFILSDKEAMEDIKKGFKDLESGKTKTFEEIFGEPLTTNVKISYAAEKTIKES